MTTPTTRNDDADRARSAYIAGPMIRPHKQYSALSRIMEILAEQATSALEHLAMERASVGGYPGANITPGSRGTSSDTSTERAVMRLQEIDSTIAQINDDMTAIASLAASALDVTRQAISYRVPAKDRAEDRKRFDPPKQCQADGRDGAELTYEPHSRDPLNGWADPTCIMPATKGALCAACYVRERRWRAANGRRPTADFIPASVA